MTYLAMTVLLGLSMLLFGGCEQRHSPHKNIFEKRVVVMSPAITQIIIDLGRGDDIVAVGRFDPAADRYPVVGDLYQMDYEKLLSLNPTDLFLQPSKDGVPTKLVRMAGDQGWALRTYEIESIADVKDAIYDGSGRGVGMTLGAHYEALDLIERIDAELLAVGKATTAAPAQRVVMLVGLNPITAAGPKTFLNEMIFYAGGDNVVTSRANRYPVLDKERLLTLEPDVIVIVDPGDGSFEMPAWLSDLAVPAVKNDRVVVLRDPNALLPSSSVGRVTAKLAKLLHPELAEQIDQAMNYAGQ